MRMKRVTGLLRKGIGGFYYVEAADAVYECKAKGAFRKENISPLAGDRVEIVLEETGHPSIQRILPRKNSLIRPPVANVDQLFLVASVCDPPPNFLVLDKLIAVAETKGMEPVLIVSKTDLQDSCFLTNIYKQAGIPCVEVSAETGRGVDPVREMLRGKLSVFIGNSGVGKSSLLNRIDPGFARETGEISQKLGRGRHTTRQVELLKLPEGGYVADTPGFSTVDMERYDMVQKDQLALAFREFSPYLDQCRFPSCSHTCEKGCAVLEAVRQGEIPPSRHASCVAMFEEVKDWKEWKKRNR